MIWNISSAAIPFRLLTSEVEPETARDNPLSVYQSVLIRSVSHRQHHVISHLCIPRRD